MFSYVKSICLITTCLFFAPPQIPAAFGQSLSREIESIRRDVETKGASYVVERPENWFIDCFNPAARRAKIRLREQDCSGDLDCERAKRLEVPSHNQEELADAGDVDAPVKDE